MPAKSEKQRKFMAAVANNPKFAKEVGVPKAVGEEFMKTKKYMGGGNIKKGSHMMPDGTMMKGATHKGYGHGGSVMCGGNGLARSKPTQLT